MGSSMSEVMAATSPEKIMSLLEKANLQYVLNQINEEFNLLNSSTLDIAITGVSRAGKSSLVDALRGMNDFEEGAAVTGKVSKWKWKWKSKETVKLTMGPKKYPHPVFPRVAMWDLPGIEKKHFQAEEYLKRTNFAEYDFFVIVGAGRFTKQDVLLAKEIQKMNKKYYFVCSKVDLSIKAKKGKRRSNFSEEETLEKIRKRCCKNLRKAGEPNPRVFLLSSWNLSAYDFPLLQNTLENELDDLKRQVIIESMPAFSKEALEKKKAAMEAHVWKLALVSCVICAIPVPGLSLICDTSFLMATMKRFCQVFGLDEESLGRLSRRVGKPVDELKSAIKKVPLANQITRKFVFGLASKSSECGPLIRFSLKFVSALGSLAGGMASFVTTFNMLKNFLSDLKEDAENVMAKVAGSQDKSTEPSRRTAMADISKGLIEKDLAELKSCLEQKSFQNVLTDVDKELKLLENTTLHIGFTGNSGAGKSSLLNAFRNMTDYEKGAAETGVEQTTMKPESYPHPKFRGIILWDLPGIGTPEFEPKEYLEKVNFGTYDFFIIVAAERFTVNDAMLALEIQKRNKRFYFVRTKVDQAIDSEKRKPNFDETRTLEEIRKYCLSNFTQKGIVDPKVFLISRWHLDKYDFPTLHKTLAADLNDLKRSLLIMAMPAYSKEELQQKKAAMEGLIWKRAALSCGVGMIPLPGVSLVCDIALLVTTMKDFCKAFQLDEDSLCKLAERVGKPIDVLKSAVKKTPLASQINPEFVRSLMTTSVVVASGMVLEEISHFIPVLGSLVGGVNSFATTFYMLKGFLNDAMEDAESVLATVTE
ncbi:uncharacterized protein LOC132585837 [Heteronotia binoei]|uniref:uncharacterized protein LOC132585837 n=1 Tax=Heteronotia binoei TaxID=13085 RepID=UPI00292F9577|nr:uncharacterized protein LOC132585837 [Heteronotia binoei]